MKPRTKNGPTMIVDLRAYKRELRRVSNHAGVALWLIEGMGLTPSEFAYAMGATIAQINEPYMDMLFLPPEYFPSNVFGNVGSGK